MTGSGAVLSTSRLVLRPYEPADESQWTAMVTDAALMRRMSGPVKRPEALFNRLLQNEGLAAWAVIHQASGRYCGHVFVVPTDASDLPDCDLSDPRRADEVGFVMHPDFHGQGLATEAVHVVVRHHRNRWPDRVLVATVDTDHIASQRVLEKAGLALEGPRQDEDGPYLLYRWSDDGGG